MLQVKKLLEMKQHMAELTRQRSNTFPVQQLPMAPKRGEDRLVFSPRGGRVDPSEDVSSKVLYSKSSSLTYTHQNFPISKEHHRNLSTIKAISLPRSYDFSTRPDLEPEASVISPVC